MPARATVIVLDGLRPEFVTPERTPNLYRLQTTGVHFQNHHTIFPSVTRVCSSSISTGSYPGVHGVPDNSFFVRDLAPNGKINTGDHRDLIRLDQHTRGGLFSVPTFTDLLRAAGKTIAIATTASPGTSLLQDPGQSRGGAGLLVNQGLILPESERGEIESRYGPAPALTVPVTATNAWATRILIEETLLRRKADYAVTWITDPDKTQHSHGLGHPISLQSIAEVDANVGQVMQAIATEKSLRDMNLLVLSDHGWINYARDWDLRQALSNPALPTARHTHADLAAERIRMHGQGIYLLPGCSATREQIIAALRAQPECGPLFTRDGVAGTIPYSLIRYDHPRAPEILYMPVWTDQPNQFGVKGMAFGGGPGSHGGGSPYEMQTFFAAAGPAFRRETIIATPTGHVDLLPTLARILELTPVPAPRCGRVLTEALAIASEVAPTFDICSDRTEFTAVTGPERWKSWLVRSWVNGTMYLDQANADRHLA
ncbi:MAG TPA: alkaline phosphatase family protein [Planctomycetota bacterium]|nr:alkaline phosphatase family protein [Planctomycetota bacterium]